MEAKVTWQGDMSFLGTATSGHTVILDSSESGGGHNEGFRPTELIAMGAIGCSSMDVVSILRKKKVNFTAYEVKVDVTSANEHPRVFIKMDLEYIVTGHDIRFEDVEHAVELSETKYCQGIAMMAKTAQINHKITIIEASE